MVHFQITDPLHCYDCVIYLWTKHGCYGLFKRAQKPSMEVWKRLSTDHAPTNKQRIRAMKRDLFKSVMRSWRLAEFLNILYSDSALKSACTSKLLLAAEHGREYDSASYFWAVSVTKAMTSQLCFHSFMKGGGRGGGGGEGGGRGGGGVRKQQWLNLTGLIQAKVYTNYLLSLDISPLMGSCDVVFVLL